MRWMDQPWAVFDTETTGIDVEQDALREIGIVWRGGELDGRMSGTLIRPWKAIPAEVVERLHIDADYLARVDRAPAFSAELGRRLLDHVRGRIVVGYNLLSYDLPLIAAELRRVSVDPAELLSARVIDVYVLAAELLEQATSLKLEAVAVSFGVACPGAHEAKADCRMTRDILMKLAPDLPAEIDDLLAFQAAARQRQSEDWERFGYWLRRSRKDPGRYRVTCGAKRGRYVDEVEPGWIRWALNLPDLPDGARSVLREHVR